MERTGTLNLRINPEIKRNAEVVLTNLGLSMSAAITVYLRQIALTGGIPFQINLPLVPPSVNADLMDTAELQQKLTEGLQEVQRGEVQDAATAFAAFRRRHS